MKNANLLLGKKVQWETNYDSVRGTYLTNQGIITQVHGNNVEIDNKNWLFLPDMKNLCYSK